MAVFLKNSLIIEEKVDGANLGISITEDYKVVFQNRFAVTTFAPSLLKLSYIPPHLQDPTMSHLLQPHSGNYWMNGLLRILGCGRFLRLRMSSFLVNGCTLNIQSTTRHCTFPRSGHALNFE
jgi:hypothetical protein